MQSESSCWVGIAGKVNFTDDILEQYRRARTISPQAILLDNYRTPCREGRNVLFNAVQRTNFGGVSPEYKRLSSRIEPFTPVTTPTPVMETPTLEIEEATTPTATMEMEITTTPEVTETTPTLSPTPPPSSREPTEEPEPMMETEPAEEEVSEAQELTPTPSGLSLIQPTPTEWDIIYLTNGNIIRGKVVDRVKGQVIVETDTGLKLNMKESAIERITEP